MIHRPLVWHEQLSRGMYVHYDQWMGGPAALCCAGPSLIILFFFFFFYDGQNQCQLRLLPVAYHCKRFSNGRASSTLFLYKHSGSVTGLLALRSRPHVNVTCILRRENDCSHQYARGKTAKCCSVLVIKWFSLCFDDGVGDNNNDRNNALDDGDDDNDDIVDTD